MKLVHAFDIDMVGNGEIVTMGLSTCMCLCVVTNKGIIMWHYGILNKTKGMNMNRVSALLNTIQDKDVIRVYLVPGIDRNADLSLKPDSRTMMHRPNTDPTASRNWFVSFMAKYPWFSRVQVLEHVAHYKELVVFHKTDKQHGYNYGRDDAFFDRLCVLDAEQMT